MKLIRTGGVGELMRMQCKAVLIFYAAVLLAMLPAVGAEAKKSFVPAGSTAEDIAQVLSAVQTVERREGYALLASRGELALPLRVDEPPGTPSCFTVCLVAQDPKTNVSYYAKYIVYKQDGQWTATRLDSGKAQKTDHTGLTWSLEDTAVEVFWAASHKGWRLQCQATAPEVGVEPIWHNVEGSTRTNRMTMKIDPQRTLYLRLCPP